MTSTWSFSLAPPCTNAPSLLQPSSFKPASFANSDWGSFTPGWSLYLGSSHPHPAWFFLLILEGLMLMSHAPRSLLDLPEPWTGLCAPGACSFFVFFFFCHLPHWFEIICLGISSLLHGEPQGWTRCSTSFDPHHLAQCLHIAVAQ